MVMREDMGLFRGKRLDNGKWVEGYLVVTPEDKEGKEFAYWIISGLDYIGSIYDAPMKAELVDPATIGEYTGLKDKNGKRIFEGDIVRHHNDNPDAEAKEAGHVYWDEGYCGWRRSSNGGFHHGVVGNYKLSRTCVYEVIGNIHDNPELLEV